MDEQRILAVYERIARVTRQMLDAARASQWDRLVALEKDCSGLFAALFEHDREPPIPSSPPFSQREKAGSTLLSPLGREVGSEGHSADYRSRKAALIRGILDDDAQIRLLVEPWLADLAGLLGSTRQEQRLAQAYQAAE